MAGVVALVVGFGSSGALAGAYGLAVTGAMLVDAALAMAVAILVWKWRWPVAALVFGLLAIPDLAFFIANALKIPDGGWLPLVVAAFIYFTITTWRLGRRLVATEISEGSLPLRQFLERMERAPDRVAGTAVFLTADATHTPAAFLHNLKHNKVLHERIIILQVETMDVPRVADANRVEVERLGKGFHTVIARYGFTEQPDVPDGAARLPAARHRLRRDGDQLLPRPRDPGAQPAFQARQMAPRLVHLALPFGLGHQDLLPHPAEPRYRTGQPDPDLALGPSDAPHDARSAPRPAQHPPGLRAADRGPVRHRRLRRSRAVAPRHDRRDGRGDAGAGAADLRSRRLLDGRLRRLRDHAPGGPSGWKGWP